MPQPPGNPVDQNRWQHVSRAHFARVAGRYDAGRTFEQGAFWAREISGQLEVRPEDWLLDVGCGTGLFARAFAQAWGCNVIGLDPAPAMLKEAQSRGPGGCWMQGCSEELGLRPDVFQVIFLSQVWHHLQDSARAAREFYRVLRPGGALFVKTYSHAQLRERWDLTVVFPELMPFMLAIYPDTPQLMALLREVGFDTVCQKCYRQDNELRPSALLQVAEGKLWSMFAYLSEEGRARGLAHLRRCIAETADAPIPSAEVHLLVCARK